MSSFIPLHHGLSPADIRVQNAPRLAARRTAALRGLSSAVAPPPPQRSLALARRETARQARDEIATRLLVAVHSTPGIAPSELIERAGIGWSTLYSHLREMERLGLVRSERVGRRLLILPAGLDAGATAAVIAPRARGAVLETSPRVRLIAHAVLADPGRHDVPSLTRALQLPRRVVYHQVRRLVEAGLVTSLRANRYLRLTPTAELHGILGAVPAADVGAALTAA